MQQKKNKSKILEKVRGSVVILSTKEEIDLLQSLKRMVIGNDEDVLIR